MLLETADSTGDDPETADPVGSDSEVTHPVGGNFKVADPDGDGVELLFSGIMIFSVSTA